VSWSDELARILELALPGNGYSYDAYLEHVHPDDRDWVDAAFHDSVRDHARFEAHHRLLLPDGRIKFIHSQSECTYDADGNPLRSIGSALDVTHSRHAEAELRKLSVAIVQTPLSVIITDPEGNIEYVNPAFTRVTGYAAEEVAGCNPRILQSGQTRPEVHAELWRTITAGEVWHGDLLNRRKNGELLREEAWISPVVDTTGKTTNYVAIKEDVTERFLLAEQLRQAQKIEAVGRLAGGIAHDFNNLLTVISGNGELLAMHLPPDDPRSGLLAEIRDAAARASALTRQLLAFSRRQVLEPRVLDVNEVVSRVESMLRRLIGEDIVLSTLLSPALGRVRVDPNQLEQIVLNLAVNARDAMPKGGRLTIQTQEVVLDERDLRLHRDAHLGPNVLLSVTDSGTGMTEDVKARIFEPFFTTKAPGKGTGLGLATVFGSVQQNGGHIEVDSELGVGTRFRVYLPVVAGDATGPEEAAAGGAPRRGSETILLVEDEPAVGRIARMALERQGYRVIEAADGRDALEVAAAVGASIDLLVTDVVMPEMGGRELAERMTARSPGLKVLYLSGYVEDPEVRDGVTASTVGFLQKPFSTVELARKVRAVIDGD
jgi:PAS domain S-box-containing protein